MLSTFLHLDSGMFWSMQYYNADEEIKFSGGRLGRTRFWFLRYIDRCYSTCRTDRSGGNIKISVSGWYVVVVTADTIGKKVGVPSQT